jgi:hypothetical protein
VRQRLLLQKQPCLEQLCNSTVGLKTTSAGAVAVVDLGFPLTGSEVKRAAATDGIHDPDPCQSRRLSGAEDASSRHSLCPSNTHIDV